MWRLSTDTHTDGNVKIELESVGFAICKCDENCDKNDDEDHNEVGVSKVQSVHTACCLIAD